MLIIVITNIKSLTIRNYFIRVQIKHIQNEKMEANVYVVHPLPTHPIHHKAIHFFEWAVKGEAKERQLNPLKM